jgi:hypothetical protein
MSKERAIDLFYGKPSEGAFKGFAEHYNKLSDNCLSAGGTGNALSSAFLIGWSPDTITTFYPKNAPTAGIESLPAATAGDVIVNAQGGKLYGYSDYFKWMTGLSVKNYRYGVRIANIAANTAGDTIINTIIDALSVIPTLSACNPRLYVNRKVWAMFLKAAVNKANTNLTVRELENHIPLVTFLGVPVKKIDVLRNDESVVA